MRRQTAKPSPADLQKALATEVIHRLDACRWVEDLTDGDWTFDDWQRRVIKDAMRHDRVAVMAPRQGGKSTVGATLMLHTAIFDPSARTQIVVSRSERQATEVLARIIELATRMKIKPTAESAKKLEFLDGRSILALPSDGSTVRGYSAKRLMLDELAFIENDTELLAAVLPMISITKGNILVVSTPWAQRGPFYNIMEGENQDHWKRHRVSLEETRHTPQSLEALRLDLGETRFMTELHCRWLDSGVSLMNLDAARRSIDSDTAVVSWDEIVMRGQSSVQEIAI